MTSTPPGSDRTALVVATLSATAMIAQQVAGKVTRDALFLSYFDATSLPRAVIVASTLSIVASLIFSRMLTRSTPARVVPGLFTVSATLFVAEWLVAAPVPKIAAVALYLHMAVFGLLVISGFWSVVNESFDPHAAKQAVSRIGAGAAFGGVLGGVLADRVAALVDIRAMLLLLAGLHYLCAIGVTRFAGERAKGAAVGASEHRLGLKVIRTTPYLQQIAWLVALVAVVGGLLDYALKAQAAATYDSSEDLVAFFAAFYTTAGIAGFLVQRLLAAPSLRRLGLGGTLATLPVAVFLTTAIGAAATRLATIVLARASDTLLGNSLFRSGLELLYTPVAPAKKRPSKAIIDVAAQRGGDLIGAGLLLLILFALPDDAIQTALALAAAFSLVTVFVVRRLNRGYVSQLAESLRQGVITLDSQDVVDATTARTMAETRVGVDRRTLLAEVEKYRSRWLSEANPSEVPQATEAAAAPGAPQLAQDLLSADPARVRRALTREDLDARVTALVIPWLAHPEVREAAAAALRTIGPRIAGTLEDALLDQSVAVAARTRIPHTLEHWADRRAARALLRGLSDPDFGVRFACGQSLARLVRAAPEVRPLEGDILAIAEREAQVDETLWANQEVEGASASSVLLDAPQRRRVPRTAEHVFTLLAVILEREPLRFSLFALTSPDENLRGTALEYLENVLPDGLKRALWRHVAREGIVTQSSRSTEELAHELQRTISPLVGRRSRA